ncbi:MAG: HAMP domain-containing sensor histidine kinase [Ardenticatenales bacterium]
MVVRSIRTRLVASYMLVGLVSVAVAGALAQSLVARVIDVRHAEALRQTAMTIADQARPLVSPARVPDLEGLIQTSSYLADAQVTILDPSKNVLADSGPRANVQRFMFIAGQSAGLASVPVSGTLFTRRLQGPLGERIALASAPDDESAAHGAAQPGAVPPIALRIVVDHAVDVGANGARPADAASDADVYFMATDDTTADGGVTSAGAATAAGAVRTNSVLHAPAGAVLPRPAVALIQVPIGDPARPAGYVQLREASDARSSALDTTRHSFTLAAIVAALVAGAFGVVVAGGMHAPLAELTSVTARMSAGDLQARARVRGRDEIAQLGGQFNAMADALAESFAALEAERDALRAFIADASHELRTPITALSNFNELLSGAASEDEIARAEFVAESRRQIERLRWLTTHLLDLSRLDAGLVALHLAPVAVRDLLADVAAAFRPAAAERRVTIHVALGEDDERTVSVDRERLTMALSNLVDNAVKYTPSGGRITLGADDVTGEAGPAVALWVEDSGVGLDPADAPHIWDRFFRGQRGTDAVEGTGLGLSIVQSIARAHGGRVAARPGDGGGTRFTITLIA